MTRRIFNERDCYCINNQGKINDFKVIFPDYHVIGISELIPDFDVEETGSTFEENAILKSEAAAKALNKTVIADDSGLEVFALNGAQVYTLHVMLVKIKAMKQILKNY